MYTDHTYVCTYAKNHSASDLCGLLYMFIRDQGWHNTNTAPASHGWQGLKRPNRARGGSELLAPLSRTAELSSIFTFCGFQASGCTVYSSKCAVNGKVGFQVQPPAQHQQLSTESIFARATFCMNRMLLNEHMNSVH